MEFKFVTLLLLQLARPAIAARLTVEWEAIPGASRYELQVYRAGVQVARPMIATGKLKWIAELPTGLYTYRLRGLTEDQQPGEWSPFFPLALAPAAPEPISPTPDARVEAKTTLTWKAVADAQRYRVEVYRGEVNVLSRVIGGTSTTFEPTVAGTHTWRVSSLAEVQDVDGKKRWISSEPSAGAMFVSGEGTPTAVGGGKMVSEIGISAASVPYRYRAASPIAPELGVGLILGLSKDWGAKVALRVLDVRIEDFEIPRYHGFIGARHALSESWGLDLGARVVSFFDTPDDKTLGHQFSGIGPAFAIDVTRPMGQSFSWTLRVEYALLLAGVSSNLFAHNYGLSAGLVARLSTAWRLVGTFGIDDAGARYQNSGPEREVTLRAFPITFAIFHAF